MCGLDQQILDEYHRQADREHQTQVLVQKGRGEAMSRGSERAHCRRRLNDLEHQRQDLLKQLRTPPHQTWGGEWLKRSKQRA